MMIKAFINILQLNLEGKMSEVAISKTLKLCITEAYKAFKKEIPQGIMAPNIRSASTNIALVNQPPVEKNMWSSLATFV